MKIQIVSFFSALTLLSGCATNNELFAKYDKSCDLPEERVVEKIKTVETIKVVDKVIYKPEVSAGLNWEPAVYFGFDQDNLITAETQRIARDAAILKKYPKLMVNIQSFTDYKGSSQYNSDLAKRRQATVMSQLIAMGIAKERIVVSPLGEELPILGNDVKGRQINRRVELMMLDETGRPMALKVQPQESNFNPPGPIR